MKDENIKSPQTIPTEMYSLLRRQKYQLVGWHSAVKKCHWLHKALTEGKFCYKCYFYGIESHRCLQMSPAVFWCWHNCLHCWRVQTLDVNLEFNEYTLYNPQDPKFIVDESINAQRRILSGYKGHPKVDPKMWEEAMNPKHVAISLTGDGTMYPRLGELIEEYHKRGFSTFLVTRGMRPDVLSKIPEPSQLYVSIEAPTYDLYKVINRPIVPRGWNLIQKTLEMLPSFSSPTVLRITLIKGYNMNFTLIDKFKKIIEISQPTYVEVKAYMHVGYSTRRLTRDAMPSHRETLEFSKKLSEEIGYDILSDVVDSRVVLLSKLRKPIRIGNGCKGVLPKSRWNI